MHSSLKIIPQLIFLLSTWIMETFYCFQYMWLQEHKDILNHMAETCLNNYLLCKIFLAG